MNIDERIIIQLPESATRKSSRGLAAWRRRCVKNAVYAFRNRLLKETGEDIFQVFVRDGYIEINIKGDIETLHVE